MNRKWAFVSMWFSIFITRLGSEGIGNLCSMFVGSGFEAFGLPGCLLVGALRHLAPSAVAAHAVPLLFVGSCVVWFFPLARVRRMFGTYDAVSGEGKRRLPSLSRPAAAVLDTLTRLKVGKGKMGGWA